MAFCLAIYLIAKLQSLYEFWNTQLGDPRPAAVYPLSTARLSAIRKRPMLTIPARRPRKIARQRRGHTRNLCRKRQSWIELPPELGTLTWTRSSAFHLIGIGGSAMSPLAGMLRERGYRVTGSDAGVYPPASTLLESLGISFSAKFKCANSSSPRPRGCWQCALARQS